MCKNVGREGTASLAMIPASHSRLTYYDLGPNFLTQGVELFPGEVWQVSKRNSQYFRSYLRKTTGGPLPPPSGARVNGGFVQLAVAWSFYKPARHATPLPCQLY